MNLQIKLLIFSFLAISLANAQNVGINTTGAVPDAGAALDIDYTNKGLLIPRVNINDLTTIAPVTGSTTESMMVYNTNTTTGKGYYYWDGAEWVSVGGGDDEDWEVNGNDVYTGHGGIYPLSKVGIGTTTPIAKLDVDHDAEDIAVRGVGKFGPSNGYLGVQGDPDFDGVNTLDINGDEIGVVGISTGGSSNDNFGVYGHSNGWGGRFEYENGNNFVELGGDTYAIRIVDGTEAAGRVLTSDANGNGTWQDISTFYDDEDWEVNGNDVYTGHGGAYPSANVGIGTTAPNAKLDVRGGDFFFNDDGNDIDVRMETQNRNEGLFLDASKDVLFVGDDFGAYQNGNTVDGETVDYVANFDNGGASGTAIGVGSIEYILDRSSETTINNRFSPAIDGDEDLGGAGRRWDEVFAQNGIINTSDRRDKKDIENLNYGLNEVMQLEPVSFNWKDHLSSPDQKGKKKIGLIAQDLYEVVPEVVKTQDYVKVGENPDSNEPIKEVQDAERLGVFYSDLIPVLIKAIQEQQKMISGKDNNYESLQKKVQNQEEKIESQEEKIKALERALKRIENKIED